MNPNWTDVQDIWDVIDHIWIGLVVITAAGIPTWVSARNHKKLGEIKDQVVNGHTSPMREDLDRMREDLDRAVAAIEALSKDITGLRRDLASEQDSRRSQIDDLRGDVDRMRRR